MKESPGKQKEGSNLIRSCYNPNWEVMLSISGLWISYDTLCSEAELKVVYKCSKTTLRLVQQGALTIQS